MTTEGFEVAWCELRAGCWYDGSTSRTSDELNAAILLEAKAHGFDAPQDALQLAEEVEGWLDDPDDADWLREQADEGVSFLNGLLPEGWSFVVDDGLFLWMDEDDLIE